MPRAVFALSLISSLVLATAATAQDDDLVNMRPPGEGPTRIEVAFYIMDLMKVIDVGEVFEADVFVLATWKDPRLAGDMARRMPVGSVWTPDVIIFNKRSVSANFPT